MPSITVKNIPADIYALLKQSAEANRRSINSEVIACIERAVSSQPVNRPAPGPGTCFTEKKLRLTQYLQKKLPRRRTLADHDREGVRVLI